MRKITYLAAIIFAILVLNIDVNGQTYRVRNFNYEPSMVNSSDGIWREWEYMTNGETVTEKPDTIYIYRRGVPDFGDLIVPDLETQIKALWYEGKMYFLIRRLDDSIVNGLTSAGAPDIDVETGSENLDATTLYFYFGSDTARRYSQTVADDDSVAWVRIIWDRNDAGAIEKRPPAYLNDFSVEFTQWFETTVSEEYPYYYALVSVDLNELAPHMAQDRWIYNDSYDSLYFGFDVEITENDKDAGVAPFALQSRIFWGGYYGESLMDDIVEWGYIYLEAPDPDIQYLKTSTAKSEFASVYPNPAHSYITVSFGGYTSAIATIYDISGREIIRQPVEGYEKTIYLDSVETGTYFLHILKDNDETMVKKLIILN